MANIKEVPIHSAGVVSRILDKEAVLVMPERGKIKVLNEVGARIWDLADGKRTLGEIAAILAEEYDVAGETVLNDILEFADDLLARNMIELVALSG